MIKDQVIAVCGGAFNPPTMAHYALYEATKSVVYFDRFIYVPVNHTYPKDGLVANIHRQNMLKAMTAHQPDIIVEDIELEKPFEGTYFTLKALEKKYQSSVLFVLGTDQAKTLKDWIEAEKLIDSFQFIVIERQEKWNDIMAQDAFLNAHSHRFITVPLDLNIASSDYREQKIDALIHPSVKAYIEKNHLYEEAL